MNAETVERLERASGDLDVQAAMAPELKRPGLEARSLQVFRLKLVAETAWRIEQAKANLVERLVDAKRNGATLAELAEVSGLSVETVRTKIQKGGVDGV